VAVVSGKDNTTLLVQPFDPFPPGAGESPFMAGGFAAAGDFDRDGRAEFVITPDQSGGPRVSIYSVNPDGSMVRRANYFTLDPNFRGGIRAAIGDVNNDGVADLAVAGGFGGGPRIDVINGTKALTTDGFNPADRLISSFFAFPDTVRNGAYIALGDVNGDGFADFIFGSALGGGTEVLVVSGQKLLTSGAEAAIASPLARFSVGGAGDISGARVSSIDADGDALADVAVATGVGAASKVRVYLGKNFTAGGGEPASPQDLNPFGGAALTDGTFVG
jgi:hypothetical protein